MTCSAAARADLRAAMLAVQEVRLRFSHAPRPARYADQAIRALSGVAVILA
jgi:hypothetical protein